VRNGNRSKSDGGKNPKCQEIAAGRPLHNERALLPLVERALLPHGTQTHVQGPQHHKDDHTTKVPSQLAKRDPNHQQGLAM
jgi:hypothetical protein